MVTAKKDEPRGAKSQRRGSRRGVSLSSAEARKSHGSSKTRRRGYTAIQRSSREDAKRGIARYVVDKIIQNGMSIFLDAGSTVHQVGACLFEDKEKMGLTIMTNNMLIFNEYMRLSKQMSDRGNVLALTGGVYNQNHEALFGQAAEKVLQSFNPVVVVIGASGFMVEQHKPERSADRSQDQPDDQGAFHHDPVSETLTKNSIVAMRTLHRVIVCDFSKIGIWDASCFVKSENLDKKTQECTIVTSVVPPGTDPKVRKVYEDRYWNTLKALEKLYPDGNVRIVRVDYNGNEMKEAKQET